MLCQQGQKLILLVNKASSARLSAVIKTPENKMFQAFGRFETLGSNLRYGIPKEVATVLYHSRKVTIASTSKNRNGSFFPLLGIFQAFHITGDDQFFVGRNDQDTDLRFWG